MKHIMSIKLLALRVGCMDAVADVLRCALLYVRKQRGYISIIPETGEAQRARHRCQSPRVPHQHKAGKGCHFYTYQPKGF